MIPSPFHQASARQREAADAGASVWVSASAGTGKTKVLTDRVIALLLAGTRPERILCLTYTRAAAAEMAIRVQKALGGFAAMDDAKLTSELIAHGVAADAPMRERARRLFARVLDCPGGLKIQTIHAFCESLLRRFPVEAGLAPHFQVLDETEQRALLAAARDEVLARAVGAGAAGAADDLARAVDRVAGRVNAESFDKLLAALTRERGRIARLLAARDGLDGALADLRARLDVADGVGEADIVAAACADDAFDGAGLRAVARAMEDGADTDKRRAVKMTPFLAADANARTTLYDMYQDVFLTKEREVRARLLTKASVSAAPKKTDVLSIVAAEAARLLAVEDRRRAVRTADGSAAALTIGAALIDAYAARKAAVARLDYDDLVLAAQGLLSTREAAQWVLYKLDGGIDHVLVDEAQDTSPEQWDVVRRLTGEFFAGSGARAERDATPRTMFAVGDAKQSIYSFQGADPAGFAEMRDAYRDAVRAARGTFRDVALQHSFRTTEPVLAAVDRVFSQAPAREGVLAADEAIVHKTIREGQAGRIELWPVLPREDAEAADPWSPDDDPKAVAARAPEAALAALIAERVKSWIGTMPMPARGRTLAAADVMVLVRTRGRLVDHLVRAFKRLNVGVTGVDRMKLAGELAVQDLLALAQFLVLPEDDYTLACVLKGPFCGLTDDDLIALAPKRKGTLWAELSARAGETASWLEVRDMLAALLARADFVRPFELFAGVLDRGGGRARLIARLGAEAEDPVNEFLELALAFERTHAPSIQGFLDWFAHGQSDIKRDLEQAVRDEVRIMTVHGAKGLQAPVVILADTISGQRHVEAPYWHQASDGTEVPLWTPGKDDLDGTARGLRDAAERARDEEYHRLLYVAMTRAEDMLVVAAAGSRRAPPAGCWYSLVQAGLKSAPGVESFTFTDPLTGFEGPALRLARGQDAGAAPDRTDPPPGAADVGAVLDGWEASPPAPEIAARTLAPSAAAEESAGGPGGEAALLSPLAPDAAPRFLKGRLVHGLLELLPTLPPDRRRAAAERYLARPMLGLSPKARAEIAVETLALLDDPAFAPLFGPASLAEVPLTGVVAGRVIAGQIDRLVVGDDHVLAVDYKTARPVPTDASAVPSAYIAQMALYRAALAAMFPGRAPRCALIYTAAPKIIDLPAALLDAAFAEIAAAK